MKAVQYEWKQKWYAFECKFAKDEAPLIEKYNREVANANRGTQYADPARVA